MMEFYECRACEKLHQTDHERCFYWIFLRLIKVFEGEFSEGFYSFLNYFKFIKLNLGI